MHVCASSHRALATLLHERTPSNGTLFDDEALFAGGSFSVHVAASTSVRMETAGAQATHLAEAELKALAQEESQVSFLVCQGQHVFALAVKSPQEQIPGSCARVPCPGKYPGVPVPGPMSMREERDTQGFIAVNATGSHCIPS